MKALLTAILLGGVVASGLTVRGDSGHSDKKPKPYPVNLKTCVVSGEEINDKGSMKPHAFVHEGQEVKLCCKSCLKDFNKEPKKYLKKIDEAAKKEASK